VAAVPPIGVLLERTLVLAPAGRPLDRLVRVHVTNALGRARRMRVTLTAPAGLRVDSAEKPLALGAYGRGDVFFRLRGTPTADDHELLAAAVDLTAGAEYEGDDPRRRVPTFSLGFVPIEYEHIRPQRMYRRAATVLRAIDVRVPPALRVAYVPGVGDEVAPMLAQLGIPVTVVGADTLAAADLSRFTTLVIGPRAYEANASLLAQAPRVLEFARRGGTVVAQYGQYEMTRPGVLPHPITLGRPADRVTEERAPVRVVDSLSRLLVWPNRIGRRDFEDGWVQERGLYMPRAFDPRWRAPLEMNDPGEPANRGGVLVTPVGRGVFVYTTLSFFRQIPAGVPGAVRLFVNLLAADPRAAAGGVVP
jgi:hypothetical protein